MKNILILFALSVRPESVKLKDLECPNCGKGFMFETGESLKG